MKLLVDCHCFDFSAPQGITTYLKGLYQSAVKQARDIDFYFVAENIDRIKNCYGDADNIHYIKLDSGSRFKRLFISYPTIIKQYGIDYAHFQYTIPFGLKDCRTIVTLHDILFKDFPKEFPLSYRLSRNILFQWSAKKADILLTVSDYTRRRINHYWNIPVDRIHITPNAVSEDFKDIDLDESKRFIKKNFGFDKYILYVSRIEPRKNQFQVLKQYVSLELWNQGYNLVFIGDLTIRDKDLDDLLSSLSPDIKKHIIFLKGLSYDEIKMWYKAASLFIYPAKAEGFGIPPLEAGAAKIPVICNNQTAMADFDFFGENHVDISDEQLLQSRIKSLLNEPADEQKLKLIQNAIYSKYNWNNVAEDFIKLIR